MASKDTGKPDPVAEYVAQVLATVPAEASPELLAELRQVLAPYARREDVA